MKCLTDNDKINIGILVVPSNRIEKERNNKMSLSQEKHIPPSSVHSFLTTKGSNQKCFRGTFVFNLQNVE